MKNKINDFVNGIVSLIISQIFIKIFGVIYSVYITNKTGFGDEGNAIYMSGYQIYALLLTISSIGVPNAIARLIAEKNGQKDIINRERIFKIALFIFAIIGVVGAVLLFVFAEFIANQILEIPESALSLMVLSPAIFFVSVNSVIKGYFNGINKIKVTAKVQFIEQILKSAFTIGFVEIFSRLSKNNTEIMAASANFATTMATFFSLMYIFNKYLKHSNIYEEKNFYSRETILHIINSILIISIPMTLNAILSSLGKNVDSITVVRILKDIIGEEAAVKKYGIISSKIDILISMPLSFNASISTALIPEITKRKSQNDIEEMIKKIKFSLLITLILGIPYSFGIYNYSKEIFCVLFPNASDGDVLLKLSSFGIVFSMLTQTINAILQGLGNNKTPVYASLIGLIGKILANIFLIRMDNILEKGVIIGNILSSAISFFITYYTLRKNIYLKLKLSVLSIKPIFGSLLMIFLSIKVKKFLFQKGLNNMFISIISISIAVIIYIISFFVMKMINKEEVLENLENTGFQKNETLKTLKNKKKIEKK